MQALLLVAARDGPTMFARISIMRALNRGCVREFDTSGKDTIGETEIETRPVMARFRAIPASTRTASPKQMPLISCGARPPNLRAPWSRARPMTMPRPEMKEAAN